MSVEPGILYLVGTPIGNRGDISDRVRQILQGVDVIAAEDTRHSGPLLKHFGIHTPTLSYHTHNIVRRTPELVNSLQEGQAIALISDAGMPGISDPGFELVQACIEESVPIVPIPGPTALICALVASGLNTRRFVFEGFLPTKAKERRDIIADIAKESRTVVIYEAPHRLLKTLKELAVALKGERRLAIARELTKRYEEFWRGTLTEALEEWQERSPKGEFTIVIAGAEPEEQEWTEAALTEALGQLLAEGVSRSQAARQVAQESGCNRRELYQLALGLPDPE